jgi:Tfp pilus assembly protein FimT
MVVVAIIGLMVTTVSVSFETLVPRERLNTSIRNLTADLMKARASAISRNLEFRLEYDLDNERYRMATPFKLGGGRVLPDADLNEEELRFYTPWEVMKTGVEIQSIFIEGVEHTEGIAMVHFDPLGSASDHLIILRQPDYERSFTLEVLALTGLVRMHDGEFFRQSPEDGDFR